MRKRSLALLFFTTRVLVPALAADDVTLLKGKELNADAGAFEAAIRKGAAPSLAFDIHDAQAFRGTAKGKAFRVLSAEWRAGDSGNARCGLAVFGDGEMTRADALRGADADMPWSCEAEPALRIVDLDGDACPEVMALYPIRPPSGEIFLQPVVMRCDPQTVRWSLDDARTKRLDKARPKSLRHAEALLRRR